MLSEGAEGTTTGATIGTDTKALVFLQQQQLQSHLLKQETRERKQELKQSKKDFRVGRCSLKIGICSKSNVIVLFCKSTMPSKESNETTILELTLSTLTCIFFAMSEASLLMYYIKRKTKKQKFIENTYGQLGFTCFPFP